MENISKVPFQHRTGVILLLIILLAAILRLVNFGQSPPGLNQDEASNAWSAYCLLKTGKDQFGVSWPVFSMRALGSYRTTLHVYLLMPFQAIGGLNIFTTRLPTALAGILTIPLIYFVGKRLFDRQVGLAAAGLLALNPWHIQQSRWGHPAALGALLGLAPLAMMLWANLPVDDDKNRRPRLIPAAIAGAVTGICCYGYHAMRLFIPAFLVAAAVVTLPVWRHRLKSRRAVLAVACFAITFAAVFGPLAARYITDSENMSKRARDTYIWEESDSNLEKVKLVFERYIAHFGLDFLFVRGDHYRVQSPPGIGQFHYYMLPLMLAGIVVLLYRSLSSCSSRVLLILVMLYPIGDCFSRHLSLHSLRSLPGLCGLVLLAGLGTVGVTRWLWKQNRMATLTTMGIGIVAAGILNTHYLARFYGQYNRQFQMYHLFHSDLIEASRWLKPRMDDLDAVFCTTNNMNQPYIITLVAMGHDPEQWFRDDRNFTTPDAFDIYTNYGKMHFMYDKSFLQAYEKLPSTTPRKQVVFIVRPGELGLKDPIHKIYRPDGETALWICNP